MNFLYFTCHIITWVIFTYFTANTLYLFVMALFGRLIKAREFTIETKKHRISVLIPSFREDQVIVDTALQTSRHDYPGQRFTVTVIADKLKPETLLKLQQIPVQVLEVNVGMKSRSLHAALESPGVRDSEIVMILDADNIMAPGCLEKVNAAFHHGIRAMQCHRTAKNKNSEVALLDAMSEEINTNLFRRGPVHAGLSATPNGSGMAFDTALIRDIFSSTEILDNPGEDREIDMQLLQRNIKMEFLDDAFILDEKVSTAGVFEKQRIRWHLVHLVLIGRSREQHRKLAGCVGPVHGERNLDAVAHGDGDALFDLHCVLGVRALRHVVWFPCRTLPPRCRCGIVA